MAETGAKRIRGTKTAVFILMLAMLCIAGSLYVLYKVEADSRWDARYEFLALDSSEIAQNIADAADDITKGLPPDTALLEGLRLSFEDNIFELRTGDEFVGMPPVGPAVQGSVDALEAEFAPMSASIDQILGNRAAYVLIQQEAGNIERAAVEVGTALDAAVSALAAANAPAAQIDLVVQQRLAVASLPQQAEAVATTGYDAQALAAALEERIAGIATTLQQLVTGQGLAFTPSRSTAARQALARALDAFDPITEAGANIVQEAQSLDQVQAAAAELSRLQSQVKFTAENNLQQTLLEQREQRTLSPIVGYVLGGLALLLLVVFVLVLLGTARRRTKRLEASEAQQQEAILRLLDEITTLADGDLTVDVTVTEDFTGAIADSINYTIDTLRGLVGTITETSDEIAKSTDGTAKMARQMNEASSQQAEQINAVTKAIRAMSESMQQVSASADDLAQRARQSVDTAHSGSETVARNVAGMTALRDQIQETSKRIKRLGESSQEIGNIIEFINDIAEQTNTLALNASIQAAMAGEAGKGFAVVAEEVQRLAERAGGATRQIETLVKTIQADTNEAIVSMERSTSNVVTNAKLSEEAGEALTRIESSSTELSELIAGISEDARQQTESATQLAGTMGTIQDIAVNTQSSAQTTATAVGNLNKLSVKLRDSVSGFKLPGDTDTADEVDAFAATQKSSVTG